MTGRLVAARFATSGAENRRTYKRDSKGRFGSGSGGDVPDTPPVRELLHGTAEAKDGAMRAVYEGQFGRYETKVTRTGGRDGQMFVEGTIHNSRGREVGRFSRSIEVGDDGKVYAHHGNMELDGRVQGSGFASEFNGHAVDWYRQSGVDIVYLDAHNIGKYAWASQGFNFGSRQDTQYHLDELHDHVEAIRSGSGKSKYGEAIPRKLRGAKDLDAQLDAADHLIERAGRTKYGEPDYPTAYEISQIGRSSGQGRSDQWLGKQFMLTGPTWQGFLQLSGGDDGNG